MCELAALVHFEDYIRDDYLAKFTFPELVYWYELRDEIRKCREGLSLEDFDSPEELADMALSLAANRWNGTWEVICIDLFVDIDELDDPDPVDWDEMEEEE